MCTFLFNYPYIRDTSDVHITSLKTMAETAFKTHSFRIRQVSDSEDKIFFVTSSRKFLWFDEETGEHKVRKLVVFRCLGINVTRHLL